MPVQKPSMLPVWYLAALLALGSGPCATLGQEFPKTIPMDEPFVTSGPPVNHESVFANGAPANSDVAGHP